MSRFNFTKTYMLKLYLGGKNNGYKRIYGARTLNQFM